MRFNFSPYNLLAERERGGLLVGAFKKIPCTLRDYCERERAPTNSSHYKIYMYSCDTVFASDAGVCRAEHFLRQVSDCKLHNFLAKRARTRDEFNIKYKAFFHSLCICHNCISLTSLDRSCGKLHNDMLGAGSALTTNDCSLNNL